MAKLLIIDGYSLLHRAYYALPLLTTSDGQATNAVYGFLTMFFRLVEARRPDLVAVAYDRGPTFRHELYSEYKAGRQKTPPELKSQIPLLEDVLNRMGVSVLGLAGFEGDDILGTAALWGESQGMDVLLVTGDRDALQLASPQTRVLITKRGISDLAEYDPAAIEAEYGVSPSALPDWKGLTGDSSDNLPGIRGVGPKAARTLLAGGRRLEDLLDDPDQGGKWAGLLRDQAEQARLSKQLATIRRDLPLELSAQHLRYQPPVGSDLRQLFERLEFKSLLRWVAEEQEPSPVLAIKRADWSVVLEGEGPLGISYRLAGPDLGALGLGRADLAADFPLDDATGPHQVFAAPGPRVLFDWKPLYRWGLSQGQSVTADFDAALAGYLLNPEGPRSLLDLARRFLAGDPPEGPAAEAAVLARLYEPLREALVTADLAELYTRVELPLVPILARMEAHGLGLDTGWLTRMGEELESRIGEITTVVHELAGGPFNLNSPIQLRQVLFERLGLPILKRTKTGPSTDAAVLESLASQHDIVALILEYRQLAKLKSTYVDGLLTQAGGRDLIQTTFNQMVTATGRLSSTEPNLQNIPIRMEVGRRLRRAFGPVNPNNLLLAADYSQIELRILAHLSQDPGLISAFLADADIHRATAAEVFGLPPEQVSAELRGRAKAVNFGIIYGISDFGLARNIGLSRTEAASYIDRYFQRYPGVKEYLDGLVAEGRELGYVTTLLKRRRYLPDLNHRNRVAREAAERMAMNTPIQGSAADIIKVAMVRTADRLTAEGLQSRLVLQVHDELILESVPAELPVLAKLLRESMEEAVSLTVPLRVDLKVGSNWYDLQPWRSDDA